MNKIKAGDNAWLRGTAIEDHGVIGFMPTFEREYIPDVPNLAAVARVLAAHPDGFMALGRVVGNIESDQKGATDFVWDYNEAELGFIRALAAALNGGAS